MRLSLCTITFRHHLQSIETLAQWAAAHGFHELELWGSHARHLATEEQYDAAWLRTRGLSVSMISDYLPFDGSLADMLCQVAELSDLATRWQTNKVRVFAGTVASQQASKAAREQVVVHLRRACNYLQAHGQKLVVETHPHTLADTLPSLLQLLEEVNHPHLKVNFDVLHVWESGVDPALAYKKLQPHIVHLHLKNVRSRADLTVFAPQTVFSAAGTREGMCPLFQGCVDYERFFAEVSPVSEQLSMALEWFGWEPFSVLEQDAKALVHYLKNNDLCPNSL